MHLICPHCQYPIEEVDNTALGDDLLCPQCGSTFHLERGSTTGAVDMTRRLGKFELLHPVGSGAFGTVFKAHDPELDRTVAVKVPRAGNLVDGQHLDRFLREARSSAQLRHPSIVTIYEVGQEGGLPYLVSDFVDGITLADLLTARRLAAHEAARLVRTVAEALQYAHTQGVVHRDVKPSNILLRTEAENGSLHPVLTDFGLAKRDAGEITMTLEGQVLGTPAYMSPEQARGEGHDVDGRSDLYSLGAILYELLTGERPFRGNTRMLLHQVLHDEPRPPRSLNDRIPRDLETICLKCLRKEPGKRYRSAGELAADLTRFLANEPIQARPVGQTERLLRWSRRNRAVASLIGAIFLVLVLGTGVATYFAVESWQRAGQLRVQKDRADEEADNARHKAADEKQARDEADARTREKTQALAVSTLRLAQGEWRESHVRRARDLLAEVPPDLRGWEWGYLQRLFHGGHLTLVGHAGAVTSVAFSPDGQRLATSSNDRTVKLWDAGTGEQLLTLTRQASPMTGLAFSPNGQHLAAACDENTVRVWDAPTGREVLTLKGPINGVSSVAFSPDGQRLALGCRNGLTPVWDIRTGEQLFSLKGQASEVRGIAFSPDGQRLATASWEPTARIWDARTGRLLLTLQGHSDHLTSVAFSPDGQRLATASTDQSAKVWDALTGLELFTIKGHTGPVSSVAFSPGGERLATASWDRTARVWDARTGQELFTFKGHTHYVTGVAFSPDGQRLATASTDQSAQVWDVRTGQEFLLLRGYTEPVRCVAFSPDNERLATDCTDGSANVWDTRAGRHVLTLKGHTREVTHVAFSPDGQRLATASQDMTVKVWDAHGGQELLTLQGHTFMVMSVAFSPDGQRLATASEDGTARVWEARTGQQLLTLQGHTRGLTGIAFSPDGQHLATASHDETARLWDARTGEQLLSFQGHTNQVWSVAFSPDGAQLATASEDRTARVWNARSGQELLILQGHTRELTGVAFSPDGKRLATASQDRTAKIWDVRTGLELVSLNGHTSGVTGVAFSPDGQRLATVGGDKTAKVWDARLEPDILILKGHTRPVKSVAFSPDSQRLATASEDRTARVWDAHTGQQLLTLQGHTNRVLGVAFSPDGQRLATASSDLTVKVWNAHTGQQLLSLSGHGNEFTRVAFSPDGQRLAATATGGENLAWDLPSGQRCADAHEARGWAPASGQSPDGRYVASIDDEVVYVHDLRQQPDANERAFRQAMARLDPAWHEDQAVRNEQAGQWFPAAFHLQAALTARPADLALHQRRGRAEAELGRWAAAQGEFAAVIAQIPDDPDAWYDLALTQLAANQPDAYRQTCARMLERFCQPLESALVGLLFGSPPGHLPAAASLIRVTEPALLPLLQRRALVAHACVLRLDAVAEPAQLVPLVRVWDLLLRGAVRCRAGRYDEAVSLLAASPEPPAPLYRALAEYGRGKNEAARQVLHDADQWLAAPNKEDPRQTNSARLTWEQRLEIDLLRRELLAREGQLP